MVKRKQKRLPLYKQIRDNLRERIYADEFGPNDPLDAEPELAKKYGVSIITVRNAVAELVNEGLVYKVQGKGTFVNNLANVRSGSTVDAKFIGFAAPFFDEYVAGIMEGIERVTRRSGYNLVVRSSEKRPSDESTNIFELRKSGVKGLIIWPTMPDVKTQPTDTLIQLKNEGCPLVIIDQRIPDFSVPRVVSDSFGGAYEATLHLVEQGCKRIGLFITGAYLSSIEARHYGYRVALENSLLGYDPELVFTKGLMNGIDEFKQYLGDKGVDGLFIESDYVALQVKSALEDLGYSVPKNIKIVGFDDRESVRHLDVPLTTVAQLKQEIGASAANLLFKQLEGGVEPNTEIVIPTRLIVRESTAILE